MARIIEGTLTDPGGRFAVVAGRFNDLITERLLAGCEDALRRHGVDTDERLDVVWVPGAFEIPVTAKHLAQSRDYAAIIALGAVIRGATTHYDYVAGGVASGLGSVALDTGIPCVFGVLTTETIEQALERAGTKAGNKGYEAGMTAIEMASLVGKLG